MPPAYGIPCESAQFLHTPFALQDGMRASAGSKKGLNRHAYCSIGEEKRQAVFAARDAHEGRSREAMQKDKGYAYCYRLWFGKLTQKRISEKSENACGTGVLKAFKRRKTDEFADKFA